jgi:hypothetical protein
MSPNGEEKLLPSEEKVDKAIQRICRHGVGLRWVKETGGILLELRCVQQKAEVDFKGDKSAVALALIATLREQVERMGDTQYANILRIVLALEDDYLGLSATERRTKAGEEFRDGERPVKASTIRTLHEPVAREQLAKLLLNLEAGAWETQGDGDGDERKSGSEAE